MTARRLRRWPCEDQKQHIKSLSNVLDILGRLSQIYNSTPFDNLCLFSLLPNTHYCGLSIFNKRTKLNIIVTLSHLKL